MEKGARSQRWGCGLGRGPAASNRGVLLASPFILQTLSEAD